MTLIASEGTSYGFGAIDRPVRKFTLVPGRRQTGGPHVSQPSGDPRAAALITEAQGEAVSSEEAEGGRAALG